MLKQIVDIIKNTALRHKAINSFKYQDSLLTNAQGSNRYYQCVIDDTSLHQLIISQSPNIFTSTFDIYIIGFVNTDETILEIQNNCYDIAVEIVAKLDTYTDVISVHDYSLLVGSHYTDDNSVFCKINLELNIPFGLCDLDEYFDDEPKDITEEDTEIILNGNTEDKEIKLNPIRLPKNEINTCGCR